MMGSSQVPFVEALDIVRDQPRIWVRLGAVLREGVWTARAFDAVAPIAPPHWEERTWMYPEARFHAFVEDGQKVAEWLRTGRVDLVNDEVVLPGLPPEAPNTFVSVQRLVSRQVWGSYEPLIWPAALYELAQSGWEAQDPQEMLIADDAPSYYRFLDAATAFFELTPGMTGSALQIPRPAIRIQKPDGRIDRVSIYPATAEVHLEGEALEGLTVELAGRIPGSQVRLDDKNSPQRIDFAIPDGLPEQAWIVLKRGSICLDTKFINRPFSARDAGVEVVLEASTEIEALVAAGEGPIVEFKERIPEEKDARRKVCRTLAAFANEGGGHLLFGVNDDGQVVGIGTSEVDQDTKDSVTRWITDIIAPHLKFGVEIVPVGDGKRVLHIEVQEGDSPPYGVDPANPSFYIRRGATTFAASTEDVRTIARTRPVLT